MGLARKVKELRKEKGLSLRDLGEKSGLAFGAIGNIERGVTKDPQISTLIKLARVFEVSIDELIEDIYFKEE